MSAKQAQAQEAPPGLSSAGGGGDKSTRRLARRTQREAREILEWLAKLLRNYRTPIRPKEALHAAEAIESYLAGRARSLDEAFGLTRKRGRPAKDDEHKEIVRRALQLLFEGKSWRAIAEELGVQDERTLRRLCKRYFTEVAAEKIQLKDLIPQDPEVAAETIRPDESIPQAPPGAKIGGRSRKPRPGQK